MKKEYNVIMLPTKESNYYLLQDGKFLMDDKDYPTDPCYVDKNGVAQHFYITSDEEINEDDWCIDVWNNNVVQMDLATKNMLDADMLHNPHSKIIATTDTSLFYNKFGILKHTCYEQDVLPQLSESFIEQLIDRYNKGLDISKVMVEYGVWTVYSGDDSNTPTEVNLLVNTDNTINIRFKEDRMYSRNEVELICMKLYNQGLHAGIDSRYFGDIDEWIKTNI